MTEKLIYMVFDDSDANCETTKYDTLKDANYWAEITWRRMTEKEKAERDVWVGALTEEDFNKAENAVDEIDVIPSYWDYAFVDNTMFDSNIYKVYEELSNGRYFDISKLGQGKDENFYNIELILKNGDRYQVKDIPYLNYDRSEVLTRDEARKYYGKYFGKEFIDDDEFLEDGDYVIEILEYIVDNNLLFPGYTYLD